MFANELWFFYALVFGTAVLGVQGLYWLLIKARKEKQAINRRLVLGTQLANPSDVLEAFRKERSASFLSSLSVVNDLVVQSGLRLSAIKIFIGIAIPCLLFYVLFTFTIGSNLLSIGLSFPVAAVVFYFYLRLARKRRIAAFANQFPDALDVIVRGLRAGHPFRVALALVAREMPDPVGSEFGILADEIMFGLDQSTAVQNLCERVGQDDLSFFSIAISIQSQTGGNLAEILARLSHLIRSRSKLRLKIRALSSEGRLSGVALSLAPFVLFGIITLISPDYFGAVRNHPIIPLAASVAGLLLLVGNVMMYRMVNFKF